MLLTFFVYVYVIRSTRDAYCDTSEGKKRPIADSEEAEISDRTGKKQRRSRALQKLEVNRVSKKIALRPNLTNDTK